MATYTVFYSWQSDHDKDCHHYLIRDAAKAALKKLGRDESFIESPRLDHDTQNLPGTPAIADAIYHKIDQCSVFIADITFVGQKWADKDNNDALVSNPNVLTELGYAASRIGWERIILVMNTHYGPPERLPFDLQQHRRFPIVYKLASAEKAATKEAESKLTESLRLAIKAAADDELRIAKDTLAKLDVSSIRICLRHGLQEYFAIPPCENLNVRLARIDETGAIARLLDHGMLIAKYAHRAVNYSYEWTYLGQRVIKLLDITASVQEASVDLGTLIGTSDVVAPLVDNMNFAIATSSGQ